MYSPPRIEERAPGRFIGMYMEMSLMEDQTGKLWRKFMPRRHEILHRANTAVVSLQVYPKGYFLDFDPSRVFVKWSLAEVGNVSGDEWNVSAEKGEKEERGDEYWNVSTEKGEKEERGDEYWNVSTEKRENEERGGLVPEGMEVFEMQGGLYAVFAHRGSDPAIFDHIYGEWLTASDFELDDRPHFEVLDVQYRHSDPDAAEEIWIPVRVKF
jgi:AraC family transcriptional regulator